MEHGVLCVSGQVLSIRMYGAVQSSVMEHGVLHLYVDDYVLMPSMQLSSGSAPPATIAEGLLLHGLL